VGFVRQTCKSNVIASWGERSRLTGVSVKSEGSPEDELRSKSPLGSCLNRRDS